MSDPAPAPEVTIDELAAAIEAGAAVVDVRERDEYTAGHVPGAVLVPLSELERRHREIPADRDTVYVVCAVGARSLKAATYLRAVAGIEAVSVAGGTVRWTESGRPVVSGDAPG